jgi:hypothetical protein
MNDEAWNDDGPANRAEQILSVDEESVPGLLEEKRRREEFSRQIAFWEGL